MTLSSFRKRLGNQGPQEDAGASKPRVVIIDDDVGVLRSLAVVLKKSYDVMCFSDPAEGAAAAAAADVAVAVVDIRMPVFDGFWVFRQIRKTNSNVAIIFNSAYQDSLDAHEVEKEFKDAIFFHKNGNVKEFLGMVQQAAASVR
jgi:DNA-binding NarL/FixJ family response regulator